MTLPDIANQKVATLASISTRLAAAKDKQFNNYIEGRFQVISFKRSRKCIDKKTYTTTAEINNSF